MRKADNTQIDLSKFPMVQAHAADPKNYFQVIEAQINNGLYDQYMPSVTEKATIIDIGANIGMFSLYCAIPNWHVYSFEPTAQFCSVLLSILNEEELFMTVALRRAAVFNREGEISFTLDSSNSTMNAVSEVNHAMGNSVTVPCTTVDAIIRNNKLSVVDFLKLDAENSEPAILDSISDEAFAKIKRMFIEFHKFDIMDHYKALLESKGFSVEKIGHDTLFAKKELTNETTEVNSKLV